MKALVTGATGFVVSHLVERLLAEGVEVIRLARPASDAARLPQGQVEVRRADYADGPSLQAAVEGADVVFHVGGLTRGRSAEEYHAANVLPTAALVQAALRCDPAPRRFVYVSSLAAVGPNPTEAPLDESSPPHPMDHYGRSKLAGEHAAMEAAGRIGVTIVRPPAVYGPRDANFLALFRTARRLGVVPVIGGRDKQVSLVHARDLAEGLWLAATRPASDSKSEIRNPKSEISQVYFIGSGTYAMADLIAALSAALDKRLRLLPVPRWLALLVGEWGQVKWALTGKPQLLSRRKVRDLLQPRWTCSWDKAARELAYRPAVTLEEGFRQTAQWYAARGWVLPS
jgi:nucleoside-diphosphate-sugar epimerase